MKADELESMVGEQLGAAEGGHRFLALWELQLEEREMKLRLGKRLHALWEPQRE